MAEETTPQGASPAAPPPAPPSAPPPVQPAAAAAPAAVEAAPAEQKIKVRKPRQRSCDEKDAKGKLCAGHLKRWYDYPKEVEAKIGKDAEIYRCEFCKTLYKPDPKQMPHSFTLRY
jgi:hypothetical protein